MTKKILTRVILLFWVGFFCLRLQAQDTLNFSGIKQMSDYFTEVYRQKYPELTFFKHRLITPQYNVYDYYRGIEGDSLCNALKYLSLAQDLDVSNYANDEKINLDYIEKRMLDYVFQGITPLSVAMVEYSEFKDSAVLLNAIDFVNNRFVDKSPAGFYPFKKSILFASSTLNQIVFNKSVNFVFNDSLFLTNLPLDAIDSLRIDYDNGQGYVPLIKNVVVPVIYEETGQKTIRIRARYKNIVYYSASIVEIADNPESQLRVANPVTPPSYVRPISTTGTNGTIVKGQYGVWLSPCNATRSIRKPYIICTGFNPGNGKQLVPNGFPTFVNFILNNIPILIPGTAFGWNGDWRGTFYETENGAFNALLTPGQPEGFDNGNRYLDRIRDEGYDVVICAFLNGTDFTQNNADLFKELIKQVNAEKLNNNAWFENVVSGYSAGGIASRLALAQMEADYRNTKKNHPHTKLWVSFETESQGATIPLGFQHFIDFQRNSGNLFPSINPLQTAADLINKVVADLAYAYNNNPTAYELSNLSSAHGNGTPPQRLALINKFATITGNTAKGYPEFCRRVGVAQGSAVGVTIPHSQPRIIDTQLGILSGSATAVSVPSSCGGTYTVYYPHAYKRTRASWWGSNNTSSELFHGSTIYNLSFTYFPKLCVNFPIWGCRCVGPFSTNTVIVLGQKTVNKPALPYYSNNDDAPASTQGTQILTYNKSAYPFYNNTLTGSNSYANIDKNLHGFASTTSCLDLSDPNTGQPVSLFTSPASLGLMNRAPSVQEPNKSYGFPHLNTPQNPYKITPYDAVFAIGQNPGYFPDGTAKPANQLHVEDPLIAIGDFLSRVEVAPEDLFLSNRKLAATQDNYKAEFEARSKIIVGNGIYNQFGNQNYLTPDGNFHVDKQSHAIMHAGDMIIFLPGTVVDTGARLDAYILGYPCENRLK